MIPWMARFAVLGLEVRCGDRIAAHLGDCDGGRLFRAQDRLVGFVASIGLVVGLGGPLRLQVARVHKLPQGEVPKVH